MTAIGERSQAARGGLRLDVRALVVFFVLAYALSSLWAFPLAAAGLGRAPRRGLAHPLPGAVRTGDCGSGVFSVDHGPPGSQ